MPSGLVLVILAMAVSPCARSWVGAIWLRRWGVRRQPSRVPRRASGHERQQSLAMRRSSDSLLEWVASEDPSMIKAFAPLALLSSLLLLHVSHAMADTVPRNVVTELAPSGKLRAAINFGNSVLAQKDPTTGEPRGVSSELARELAKRLAVPIEFVTFDAAGKVFD